MMSLSARIALGASVVLAIFIALTALALDKAFHDSARSATRERLWGQIYLLMAAAEVSAQGRLSIPTSLPEARFTLPGSGLYAHIVESNGNVAWRSQSTLGTQVLFSTSLAAGNHRFERREDSNGQPYYVLSYGINWTSDGRRYPFTFTVAEDLAGFYAQIRRYRRSLWGWLGAMALLLLITQAVTLRWGLRPLRRVASELAAVESGRQEQLKEMYPRELKGLTDNLNALLRHERTQQKRYRDALADLAHSVKTPLAVLRSALSGEQHAHRFARTVEDQIGHMDHIVQYQLQRAATAGRTILSAPVPIKPVLLKIIDSLKKVHHNKRVEARVDVYDKDSFRGDEGDLMELLGNPLDNAFKWCRSKVRVSTDHSNGHLIISIDDDGSGIGAAQADRFLKRGVRADSAVPGHGIGLAIVRDIVQAYEGRISIRASDLGGAQIRIELPSP